MEWMWSKWSASGVQVGVWGSVKYRGDSTKNRFCDSPNDVSPEDAVVFFRLGEKTALSRVLE